MLRRLLQYGFETFILLLQWVVILLGTNPRFRKVFVLFVLGQLGVSEGLAPYITPLSQCIIIMGYLRAKKKGDYREHVKYRDENGAERIYSRVSFKTVGFFPIGLLLCWLASENTGYLISYLYLAQLVVLMDFPRVEYMMTKDTPEGGALREYAKKELNEEKLEQKEYTLLYSSEVLNYKKHEYYLWGQMQGEAGIFRIKAFSQFTKDIICCILIFPMAILLGLFYLPIPHIVKFKYSMEQLADFNSFFIIYGWIIIGAWLYLADTNYHRYYAGNYFFYYNKYREAAGPRKENPGTGEYYYYIITGIFPKKYRDLQDVGHLEKLKELGLRSLEDEIDEEAIDQAHDDLIGADGNLDAYDGVGGEDLSFEVGWAAEEALRRGDAADREEAYKRYSEYYSQGYTGDDMFRDQYNRAAQAKREYPLYKQQLKINEEEIARLKEEQKNNAEEIARLEKEQPEKDNSKEIARLKKRQEDVTRNIAYWIGENEQIRANYVETTSVE